jgi:hypothetical protein
MHGKVQDINPNTIRNGRVTITYMKRNVPVSRMRGIFTDPPDCVADTFTLHEYEMTMMSVNINGTTYRAPAMHPDGSIFLTHVNPRKAKNV